MKAINAYFLDVLTKHYFDFEGRASRKQFWMYILFLFIAFVVLAIITGFLGRLGSVIYSLCGLAVLLPNLGMSVRRMHDIDRSGWWVLLNFVPVLNLVFLVFTLLPGTPGANRFDK